MVHVGCLAGLLAAAASLASARTPPGFTPATTTELIVEYNGFVAQSGAVVPRNSMLCFTYPFLLGYANTPPATIPQPRIGTLARLTGQSYAVFMIDLDIPTNNPPATNTLLHWLQTGLTPAAQATRLNTTTGQVSVFLLENSTNTAPITAYFGPNPPARIPLSHRYTQILVDTSTLDTNGLNSLRTAAATIIGFNAQTVLGQLGLADKVVAGNFYNVTNPGPVNGTGMGPGGPVATAGVGRVGPAVGMVIALAGVLMMAF